MKFGNSLLIMTIRQYVFIILFLSYSSLSAQEGDLIPWYYSMLPGGSHFYIGDYKEGALFSTTEVSFFSLGYFIRDKINKKNNEINVPFLLAGQIYIVDQWSYYQKILIKYNKRYPNHSKSIQFDSTPLTKLIGSPFQKKSILSPFVISFALLGIVDGIIAYPKHEKSYTNISTITAIDSKMNRKQGTMLYESMAFNVSYGAAVSEELFFRGLLLPVLDYKFGKGIGLISSSFIFGSAHLFNPGVDKPFYLFAQAFIAGFVFGNHVQRNNYMLSEVIAAHFWYNFFSSTTTWLNNPKENPLGFRVQFDF